MQEKITHLSLSPAMVIKKDRKFSIEIVSQSDMKLMRVKVFLVSSFKEFHKGKQILPKVDKYGSTPCQC
jgi:hypothetical protein